jgi:hypothetical protein
VLPPWSFEPGNEADLRFHFAQFLSARAAKFHFAQLVLAPAEIGRGAVTRYVEVLRYGDNAKARIVRESATTEIQLAGTEDPRRVMVGKLEARIDQIRVAMGRGGERDGAVELLVRVDTLPDLASAYELTQVLGREAEFPGPTGAQFLPPETLVRDQSQPWRVY